jgi:redox-sensitive bicupin YhaK (pirin superfamily)
MTRRAAQAVFDARPTLEGAGVRLRRAFGFGSERAFDPFLMLDDFRADDPADFAAGFPWHPHRGIETITYVIGAGDVQWMTAGSGIVHQEMPKGDGGHMWGFQLWANLPAADKMTDPRYRGLTGLDIPEVRLADEVCVRVIAGEVDGVRGPVEGIVIDPEYLDVTVRPGCTFEHGVEPGHTAFAYAIEGAGEFAPEADLGNRQVILYTDGDSVRVRAGDRGVRFLLLSGRPLREPIAWGGPIVMNTEEELREAFREYGEGTFIKHPLPAA